jgi:hypothetical protein
MCDGEQSEQCNERKSCCVTWPVFPKYDNHRAIDDRSIRRTDHRVVRHSGGRGIFRSVKNGKFEKIKTTELIYKKEKIRNRRITISRPGIERYKCAWKKSTQFLSNQSQQPV